MNTLVTWDSIKRFYPSFQDWREFLEYNFIYNGLPYISILKKLIQEQAEPLLDSEGKRIN